MKRPPFHIAGVLSELREVSAADPQNGSGDL